MASNALVNIEHGTLPTARDWETMLSMAEVLVKSGMLPAHIKTPQAAVAIIQKGRELGIQPMYALSNIVNIQGKPTANSELMLALIYRDHGDNAITFTASDNTACHIAYARRTWKQAMTYAFTIEDAKAAGLMGNQTWQKYPAAMLRARCISAVARMAFPDSIGGMYTPEELGAEVDEDGTPIIAQIEQSAPREIRAAAPPAPARPAAFSEPRLKASAQPNGVEEAKRRLVEVAQARGVDLTEDMDSVEMAATINAALTRAGLAFRVQRSEDGTCSARALHNALVALPPRTVDAETGEVLAAAPLSDEELQAEIAQGSLIGTGQ